MHNILPLHELTIRMNSALLMCNTKWNANIHSIYFTNKVLFHTKCRTFNTLC